MIKPQTQEGQQILSRINNKKTIPGHIKILLKTPKIINIINRKRRETVCQWKSKRWNPTATVTPDNSKIPKEVLQAEVKWSQTKILRFKKEWWTKAEMNIWDNLKRHRLYKTKIIMACVVRIKDMALIFMAAIA